MFPLDRGLCVVDQSSFLGQIVFQAQIDLGIVPLLYSSRGTYGQSMAV